MHLERLSGDWTGGFSMGALPESPGETLLQEFGMLSASRYYSPIKGVTLGDPRG